MENWKIEKIGRIPKLNNVILIEGLPGIGNVGKIAVDFIVEELKARKAFSLFSYSLPHSVFVNDSNLVELPAIEIYHYKGKRNDFLFLVGDTQPIDERSCYGFCDFMIDFVSKLNCKEIVTTGGIGLQEVPEKPMLYCTGNSKKIISRFKLNSTINDQLYGFVGPIIGVSGVLLGLAQKKDIEAITLLAETLGHPLYVGVSGAKEIVKVLSKQYSLKIDIKKLEKEITDIEAEMIKKSTEIEEVTKQLSVKKIEDKLKKEVSYIG